MKPYHQTDNVTLYHGDVLDVLPQLPERSIQCVVTSPPYYALRDYGTGDWEGGDPACQHIQRGPLNTDTSWKQLTNKGTLGLQYKRVCNVCGAKRLDTQIGLEATPQAYVENLVKVFREVRRVLRDDGVVWLNLGDTYAASHTGVQGQTGQRKDRTFTAEGMSRQLPKEIKPKDLIGIPWMVAFALRADGWWLRADVIWNKPNPMPESVIDRPTKAHEYIFLLTKSSLYYYDSVAIQERAVLNWTVTQDDRQRRIDASGGALNGGTPAETSMGIMRNKRSVWTVTTKPLNEAHFATFPEDLIKPCILAGTSEKGACSNCGAPWLRLTEDGQPIGRRDSDEPEANGVDMGLWSGRAGERPVRTIGWGPGCECDADIVPCVVLDPFLGSGTTARVSIGLGQRAVGVDLNADYLNLAVKRSLQPGMIFA